jgi:hypothetical protein
MTPKALYFIDGMDLWTTFGIGIEGGSDDFLKIPERKESTTHDWPDEDGIDVDLSRTFYKQREVTLKCWSKTANKTDFYAKYSELIALFRKPGTRRLSINRHNKDYYIHYKANSTFDSFNFTVLPSGNILTKFNITVVEVKPGFNNTPTFIIDEVGRFIIT